MALPSEANSFEKIPALLAVLSKNETIDGSLHAIYARTIA
jgi:hypothetical protein